MGRLVGYNKDMGRRIIQGAKGIQGTIGLIRYSFDGENLTLYPYQRAPGYDWPPSMAVLTEAIIIPAKLLSELLAHKESDGQA